MDLGFLTVNWGRKTVAVDVVLVVVPLSSRSSSSSCAKARSQRADE